MFATAALFTVLIAAPFTAPFSACSPSTLLAHAPDANLAIPSATAVMARDKAAHRPDREAGVLTEDQFKDEAAIVDASVEETIISSAAIGTLRPATSSVTRAIPAVLRV